MTPPDPRLQRTALRAALRRRVVRWAVTRAFFPCLLVLGACVLQPQPRSSVQDGDVRAVLDLKAPERVGNCTLTQRTDSGRSDLGIAHQYKCARQGSWSTFFYVPRSMAPSPGSPSEDALEEEMQRFRQVLEVERERGVYQRYQIAEEKPADSVLNNQTVLGRALGYVYSQEGAIFTSAVFVFLVRDGVVKVRWTITGDEWHRAGQPNFVEDFMVALAKENPALAPPSPRLQLPADPNGIDRQRSTRTCGGAAAAAPPSR